MEKNFSELAGEKAVLHSKCLQDNLKLMSWKKEDYFIMDNFDAIIEFDNSMKENQGQPWSPEHDRCLLDLYQKGVPMREIAVTLRRNAGAVRARLKKLGVAA